MTDVVSSSSPSEESKKKLKPLYSDFQVFYKELLREAKTSTTDETICEDYNSTVDELINKTGQDYYSKFKAEIHKDQYGNPFVLVVKFRMQLTRLLSRLHQEYFSDEPSSLNDRPSTSNNTTNYNAPISVFAQNSIIGNDGKIALTVTVGELVNALAEGIDKNLPDSQEKQGILETLKNILKSDTFTTVLGKSVGEFFKTITHQR